MKNIFNIKTLLFVAITSLLVVSCTDDDYQKPVEEVATVDLSAGSADFSKFVSVGNSLTAGFTDGALFIRGQENSIPNLVANKFAMAGGGDFTQPLMNDNIGGLLFGGSFDERFGPRYYFYNDTNPEEPNLSGPMPLGVTPYDNPMIPSMPTTDVMNVVSGPYNNMGVPGAKTYHLGFSGYGNAAGIGTYANPYYVRMASSPSATVIGDAAGQAPTFFSLWIGSNDVLRYALNGGDGVDQTGNFNPATYGDADITDPNVFEGVYSQIVDALTANEAKGVILNLPDVTSIPYFTTVPFAPLSPLNEDFAAQIPTLNAKFAGLNMVYDALGVPERKIIFSETEASPVVIHDEFLTDLTAQIFQALQDAGLPAAQAMLLASQYGQSRQATVNDLLVLPSKSIIGTINMDRLTELMNMGLPQADAGLLSVNGISYPLRDKWVLLPSEQTAIQIATDAYNATIESLATAKGLAFVDVNTMMNNLGNGGLAFDEFTMTNQYIFGNTFSLDGVHPTERGNAFIANEILKAIDATYNSNFEVSGNLNKAKDFVTQYPATLQ